MSAVLAGLPVTLTKSLDDGTGNVIPVQSVKCRVVDEAGIEIVPAFSAPFNVGDAEVTVTIPGMANTVMMGVATAPRIVEFACTIDTGEVITLSDGYLVRSLTPLVVGVNSFQTLTHAALTALEVPTVSAWNMAAEADRVTALVSAHRKICGHRFNVPWLENDMSRESWGSGFIGSLEELPQSSYLALPQRFQRALRLAQVAEAESILSGDAFAVDDSVMLESIGEVKRMYRSGIKVRTALSRATLAYIGRYIDYNVRVRR